MYYVCSTARVSELINCWFIPDWLLPHSWLICCVLQGREKDYVIVTCVLSNVHVLTQIIVASCLMGCFHTLLIVLCAAGARKGLHHRVLRAQQRAERHRLPGRPAPHERGADSHSPLCCVLQGREKDYIIVPCVRSNVYVPFLTACCFIPD